MLNHKLLLAALFIFISFHSSPQNDDGIWYFGNSVMDFNSGSPVILNNTQLNAYEGSASISDSNGNLLFYTNGNEVYNGQHNIMQNGNNLKGDISSTQAALIVPKPENNNIYYVFTVGDNFKGIWYSVVDMNQDGGLGGIISKNIPLITPTPEKITAVRHFDGSSIWVITHGWNNNAYYAYLVSSSGINTTPVISNTGIIHHTIFWGYLKPSVKGDKLAVACGNDGLELLDFDDLTGKVSNPRLLGGGQDIMYYGVEFSPDGSKLYTSTWGVGRLYQFNLNAGSLKDIKNSRYLVHNYGLQTGAIQLGPDGKIYVTGIKNEYLDIIESPNESKQNCNFKIDAIYLKGNTSPLGLPAFIHNYSIGLDFDYNNLCFGDNTSFSLFGETGIDSVYWDFGDETSGKLNNSDALDPSHVFSYAGEFKVKLKGYYREKSATVLKTVKINNIPEVDLGNDEVICKGNELKLITNKNQPPEFSYNYLWSTNETTPYIIVSPERNTTFGITVTDENQCTASDEIIIQVLKTPEAKFKINSTNQCLYENNYQIINNSDTKDENVNYHWNFGDGKISSRVNPTHTYSSEGIYEITLIAEVYKVCFDTFILEVRVFPKSSADFDFEIDKCNQVVTFVNQSENAFNYTWDFGNKNIGRMKDPVRYYGDKPGEYNVKLVTNIGTKCSSSITKFITIDTIYNNYLIPNAFTPNNDGLNDIFKISNLDRDCDHYEVLIFSRTGEMIYTSENFENNAQWDGRFEGELVPVGAYFYLLKGSHFSHSGTVTVIY